MSINKIETKANKLAQTFEQQLQNAIENIGVGFILWDNQQKLVTWNSQFLEFNPEFEGKLKKGMTFEELIRLDAYGPNSVMEEDKREVWIQERLIEHDNKPDLIQEIKRPNGMWLKRIKKKLPDGSVVATTTDITEFKKQEDVARRSEKVLSTAIESITHL